MSTKAQLQTAIENALETPITKIEHVAAEVLVLDNLYPSPIICNNLPTGGTNGILTPNATTINQFRYGFIFRKIGSCVYLEGFVQNLTNTTISASTNLATISNNEFLQDIGTGGSTAGNILSQNLTSMLFISQNTINILPTNQGLITPNQVILFKGFYFTQP